MSLGCEAEGKPLVVRDGRKAMVSSVVKSLFKCKEYGNETHRREEETEWGEGGEMRMRRKRTTKSQSNCRQVGATAETKGKLRNGGVSRRQDSGTAAKPLMY